MAKARDRYCYSQRDMVALFINHCTEHRTSIQTLALARLPGIKWLEKLAKWRSTCFSWATYPALPLVKPGGVGGRIFPGWTCAVIVKQVSAQASPEPCPSVSDAKVFPRTGSCKRPIPSSALVHKDRDASLESVALALVRRACVT